MDADVSRWVLEFLLRQGVEDRVLNDLVRVIPVPKDEWNLNKAMLVRKIESEIAKGSVSQKILELLELVEELDHKEGVAASEAIKAAYCAVAVDCTVTFIDECENSGGKYFDAVKRIWRGRVWKMEKLKKIGLVSDELLSWKDDIEAALWETSDWENVRVKSRGNDALEAVRVYVAEERERMGPSFLEFVAGEVSSESGDKIKEFLGLGKSNDRNCGHVGEGAASWPDSCYDLAASLDDQGMQKGVELSRHKHVANKHSRGVISGSSGGVNITDAEELDIKPLALVNSNDGLPNPEIGEVQETLRTSSLKLQAAVKDPLPDSLQFAENMISNTGRENINEEATVGHGGANGDAINLSFNECAEAGRGNEANLNNHCLRNQNDVSKPCLMARNSTACTYEWDDSIEASPEGSPDNGSRPHLPTPNRRIFSPLKKYELTKLAKRRRKRKWTTEEEDTLRTAVQKYGAGNWKFILSTYRDAFEERTEVDLKDKWRNMIRY